tara:strand:+ start:66 stop:476 length:411 start_codon:yes stop_codon:yes gene_type:complete
MALGYPTLREVSIEIYGDANAGRNLTQCFIDATGTFSPAYIGNKDRLSNFRNYVHTVALTSFTASSKGKANNVCGKTDSVTYYHNGSGNFPTSGDNVYTDNSGTSILASGYYKINLSYFTITSTTSGEVSGIGPCS